jgi:hypothetical protein
MPSFYHTLSILAMLRPRTRVGRPMDRSPALALADAGQRFVSAWERPALIPFPAALHIIYARARPSPPPGNGDGQVNRPRLDHGTANRIC